MKKVILYPRVSSAVQVEGESMEAQESRLKNYCEIKGYEIVGVWKDEGKSASFTSDKKQVIVKDNQLIGKFHLEQRPSFQKIIQRAGDGSFDAVVFFKWDRISRDVVFAKLTQYYLDSKGIELIPTDDSDDPLASSIMQIMGEEEIKKLKQRVKLSRLERFNRGEMVARSPFGYRPIFKDKIKRKGVIGMKLDKVKAKIVQRVFEMTADGEPYSVICRELKLKPQSYYNIVRNKVYIGYIEFEGESRKGTHPPIITEELFYQCNLHLGKT